MTEQEIEILKNENTMLRLRNERLESDIKKFQDIVKSILIGEIVTELTNEELVAEEEANGEANVAAYTDNNGTNENPA
jgi:hypothetical protein